MMVENPLAAAQQLLNTSPVAAAIVDKSFNPIWYNNSYHDRFRPFRSVDDLLGSLLTLDSDDSTLFMFKKIFIPIHVRYNPTGENLYLTKFPIFKGEKFIISLVDPKQWSDDYSYSDEFFREAFLMTPNPIVLFSFNTGKIKYQNSAFSKICSMPSEHIINMFLVDLFPDAKGTIEEYLARPEPYVKPFILNAIQADNNGIVLEISPFVFNENGNVMVVFNMQDITKHMTNNMDVITDEVHEYDFITKAMTDAVIVTEDKKIIKINDNTCKFWGYAENELVGAHVSFLFQEGKPNLTTSDGFYTEPFVGVRKDGSTFEGQKISRVFFIDSSHLLVNVLHPLGYLPDLNQGHSSSSAVSGKSGFDKKVLDYQPNLIAVYDRNDNVISCNKAMLDFFKCDSFRDFQDKYSEINKFFIDKTWPFLTSKAGKRWFTIPAENKSKEYKVAMSDTSDSGAEKVFIVKSSVIQDEDASYVVSFSDITDTMQTTLAVKDANSLLLDKNIDVMGELKASEELLVQQQKLASMGEMLSVITHQWKQPLNAVGILTQQIALLSDACMECPGKKELAELTVSILEHISFMSETADNFKDFLKSGMVGDDFVINATINATIKILSGAFKQDNISIYVEEQEGCGPITVKGNKNDLSQVVINVVSNAKDAILLKRKASQSGVEGKIRITLLTPENNVAEIRIEDNGVGIPQDVLPKIFDRYFSTKGIDGTGIGMYISKILIDKLGGTVQCGNREDGAYIHIRLPVVDNKTI